MASKSILISIQPQWVAKILNGEKTIEVRKKFPKDYVGWVYIYCTKGKRNGDNWLGKYPFCLSQNFYQVQDDNFNALNGYVVARFWCDKVEEIRCSWGSNFIDWSEYPSDERYDYYIGNEKDTCDICRIACLKMKELDNYLKMKNGYAINISKLEIFDKPKELKEFRHTCKAEYRGYNRWQPCSKECKNCICNQLDDEGYSQCFSRLTKAPQSWCYIEDTL